MYKNCIVITFLLKAMKDLILSVTIATHFYATCCSVHGYGKGKKGKVVCVLDKKVGFFHLDQIKINMNCHFKSGFIFKGKVEEEGDLLFQLI